jgi:4-azaleucine resistance transporter AzlC
MKQAFLRTIPVMMGYLVLGIAFGLLLHQAGYHWVWALGISCVVFAGSLQFVLVGLLVQEASLTAVAITTLLVNSRHLFYGLSFIEQFRDMGKRGLYMMFSLTDETYALLCASNDVGSQEEQDARAFWIAVFDQCYWVTGSVAGAVLGSLISFNITGIEFAMTALFTVIFVEQWLSAKHHLPAIIGLICAVLSLVFIGPDNFLLPALVATVTCLLLGKSFIEDRS